MDAPDATPRTNAADGTTPTTADAATTTTVGLATTTTTTAAAASTGTTSNAPGAYDVINKLLFSHLLPPQIFPQQSHPKSSIRSILEI